MMRQSVAERSQITESLKQMFLEERASANKEMQEFLKTFQA